MKTKCLVALLASFMLFACSKDNTIPQGEKEEEVIKDSLFTRIQQGVIPGEDTVLLISWDANQRIARLVDSGYLDTIRPVYDLAGNLKTFVHTGSTDYLSNFSYTHNSSNQLTEFSFNTTSHKERTTFEYSNGVISKKTYYTQTNLNSPTLNVWRYYTFEVTNGNVTKMFEYDAADKLRNTTTYTFTGHPNIFKPIAVLNALNWFGLEDVANDITYFNKNLIATSTDQNGQSTFTYQFDSHQRLEKFEVKHPFALYTRMLAY